MTLRNLPALLSVLASLATLSPGQAQQAAEGQQPTEKEISDSLDLRFANGIAAIAEDKVITVDDLRREIQPYIAQIQRDSHSREEFNTRLQQVQEDVLQDLIDRVLIVKEFYKDEKRRVPPSIVDNQIAETIINEFDGDRSKYLAYLRSRSMSQKEYRKEVEERIIYDYMRSQQRKSASTVSPVQIETYYKENKDRFYQEDSVHMRLIQVQRAEGTTDEELKSKADEIMTQLHNGTSFADVARLYSQDSRRNKGGDWGWQRRSDLRKEFSDVIFSLEPGKYSDPVIMPEGAFIFFVEERKYAGTMPLDEVRDQIERMLVSQNSQKAQERWLERLRRNAYVRHF